MPRTVRARARTRNLCRAERRQLLLQAVALGGRPRQLPRRVLRVRQPRAGLQQLALHLVSLHSSVDTGVTALVPFLPGVGHTQSGTHTVCGTNTRNRTLSRASWRSARRPSTSATSREPCSAASRSRASSRSTPSRALDCAATGKQRHKHM